MRQSFRSGLAALAAAALTVALATAGCGGDDDDAGAAGGSAGGTDGLVIGNSIPQGSDPVLAAQAEALEAEAGRYGAEVISTDANVDPSKQLADVESLLQRGIDVLVIWPLDSKGIQPVLDRVRERDIPIIVRDTGSGGPYYTNFEADDAGAGMEAAKFFADELGDGAQVAGILGPEVVEVFAERNRGFVAGARRYGLDLVDTQTNQRITPDASGTFAQQWKQRFGADLKGIFDAVDLTALAAAAAKDGSFEPAIVGIGGGEQAIQGVAGGQLAATFDMHPILVGRAEAWAAKRAVDGAKLPRTIEVPLDLVTRDQAERMPSFEEQIDAPLRLQVRMRGGHAQLATGADTP